MSMKLERQFQSELIAGIKARFPNCLVLKNDSSYLQGVPDILVLSGSRWAMLEVKRAPNSPVQPNQEYYIDWAFESGFGAFVYPENVEEVMVDLEDYFSF